MKLHRQEMYKYAYLTMALILVFWVLSTYEFFLSTTMPDPFYLALLYKYINDFWCGFIIAGIVFPIFLLCHIINKKVALQVVTVLFIVLVIGQFSLIKYSLTTLLNLGADLLGYSLDDISSTVSTSESISLLYFSPFIVFPLLFVGFYLILKRFFKKPIGLFFLGFVLLFGVLKLVLPKLSNDVYKNKIAFLAYDIVKFEREQSILNDADLFDREDFPLLRPSTKTADVLSPFFNKTTNKPNIVVVVVEGLGSEFVDNDLYSGFTPYLDSLIDKSLYWKNFVSTTGRSFGILPSLFGSLPFGEKGFLEITDTPSHVSLISLLKANGYFTSYYSGGPSAFDRKINFLEYNGIDQLIDESKYGPGYSKTRTADGGFSWGYPDDEIFRKTLTSIDAEKQPRLDIIMTLSSHEPFEFPNKDLYISKVDDFLKHSNKNSETNKTISNHRDIFACLLYTDNAIKEFMQAYSKRPEYSNTIFVITGDHRLIPVVQKDKLCRFHVPFLIYSPMLKNAQRFKSVSSHWDVAPSLLSYLTSNYRFKPIEQLAWMGNVLDTVRKFRNTKIIPLMRYKGSVNDMLYKDYFFSNGDLFKVNDDFGTYKIIDETLNKTISDSLMAFKKLNAYVTQRKKIFPDSLNIYVAPKKEFSKEEMRTINRLVKNKTFDEIFGQAKALSIKKEFKTARLLCDYILNEYPNYTDARILKGRSFGWQKDFSKAEVELLDVLKRSPYYDDGYLALLDLYWWSNKENQSKSIYQNALKNEITNPLVGLKMAQAYKRLGSLDLSRKIMDSLVALYPNNSEFSNFKSSLQ